MKLTLLMVCLLVALCGVVAAAWALDEAPNGHGIPHAQFARTMQQGGPGAARHDTIRALGWGFGSLQIVLLVASLLLGVREPARRGPVVLVFLLGAALLVILFSWLIQADASYARDGSAQLVGAFPLPTAILVYGIATVPMIFIAVYILFFDRWILTPQDMCRFRRLVDQKRQERDGPS